MSSSKRVSMYSLKCCHNKNFALSLEIADVPSSTVCQNTYMNNIHCREISNAYSTKFRQTNDDSKFDFITNTQKTRDNKVL